MRTWKVGELARRTGLTVRTLHHYDAIGLFRPSSRTPSGHRLYTARDLERLQRILSLRLMGLGLEEIRAILESGDASLEQVLRGQIDRLQESIDHQRRLRSRLELLLARVSAGAQPSSEDLLWTMESMMETSKYYSREQLDRLAARGAELGEDAIRAAEREWPALIAAMKSHAERGTDPTDPAVQELGRRWRELVRAFTGGDRGIRTSLGRVYAESVTIREETGIDAGLQDYVRRVLSVVPADGE